MVAKVATQRENRLTQAKAKCSTPWDLNHAKLLLAAMAEMIMGKVYADMAGRNFKFPNPFRAGNPRK